MPRKYRIEDYWSSMVIKPYTEMNQPGIEFSLSYFDNPGVNVPSSVTTWVSIRAMPDFLERLREATKKYKDYCKREGINEVCKVTEKEINEKIQKEQLQHLFKNYKNIKLKSVIHPKTVIEGEISKPSERQNLNTSNVTENSNNSTSDMNSRSSSVIMQPENEYAWFYILHG
ncbi:hypothetical protein NQ318_018018 [Aromia moschata]|uniref:Uncharacterized protein n=1 Tax=Aromia moschata TaxID=1265417 RepID=A0AAV8ZEH0_9CUCU|nr:hypothetical protein NQ318_018018 [Aromia moschata]